MIKYFSKLLLITFLLFLFVSFSFAPNSSIFNNETLLPPFQEMATEWVDSVFSKLSLDEKIGQLFLVAAYSNLDEKHEKKIEELINNYHIGGLIFFQGSPVKQALLTNRYQKKSKIPLFIAQDCEWGLGMRLDSVNDLPYQMMVGAVQDDKLVYEMGSVIGKMLNRIGVNMNFAPVIDINNNPQNPVINYRSFGSDKINVARKGYAYMKGLQDNNILAIGKHFPGHGDTDVDSHKGLPIINHERERLYNVELFPFRYLIRSGLSGIMTAHLSVPAFDSTGTPASLSHPIVTTLLKEQMDFEGLVITDALNMKGARDVNLRKGKLEVKALQAGNDILLMSKDVQVAIKAIKKALKHGVLNQKQIDISCKKILKAKYWNGLSEYKDIDLRDLTNDLNNQEVSLVKNKLIESSITMLRNRDEIIPLKRLDTLKIASVNIGKGKNSEFQSYLSRYTFVKNYSIDKNASISDFNILQNELKDFNLVIVGITNTKQKPSAKFGISDRSIDFINKLSKQTDVVLALFSNAYSLSLFEGSDNVKSIILAYDDGELIQKITAESIFGGIPILGHLPVNVSGKFSLGDGLTNFKKIRLKYSIPEIVGLDSKLLEKIDSLAENAIDMKATPGCQVLVAREGVVVYDKAFGYQTYAQKQKVKTTDIYDLASLTKVSATLPSLMKLYESGKVNIDSSLSVYLPETDTTNKANLIIKDILCHQARLKAWIPFFRNTIIDDELDTSIYKTKAQEGYTTKVANNLYILDTYRDSIFNYIYSSELREDKKYKYSDLGYYMLKKIIERQVNMPIQDYVQKAFYVPLGATSLGYLPLLRFDTLKIIPTEDDKEFRNQIIRGYVHDPGAAMLGGVSGHAGLFSNANDLAKLMQMYLQGGEYGDVRYLKGKTIKYFSTAPFIENENRRGIGFDKPVIDGSCSGPTCSEVSQNSFGHTGFTGTIAWIDPDKQLVYIFLSNRINPDADNLKLIELNVRTSIQEAIYKALR